MDGCLFRGCTGGAVWVDGYASDGGQIGRVSNCIFRNNTGLSLLVNDRPEFYIEDCVFQGNSYSSGSGAAINVKGTATNANVRRNLFVSNSGTHPSEGGSVFYWNDPRGEIAHNTFVLNEGTDRAAACRIRSDPWLSIHNNVFAENTGGPALVLFAYSGQPTGGCNLFWNNPDGNTDAYTLKETDMIADPLFCDSPGGDFSVSSDSPCIPPGSGACGQIGHSDTDAERCRCSPKAGGPSRHSTASPPAHDGLTARHPSNRRPQPPRVFRGAATALTQTTEWSPRAC